MKFSRRKLLAGTALTAALPFSTIASAKPTEKEVKWDQTVQVLIAGAGLAGLSAAVQAAEDGAKDIVLLEKGSFVGGHALISGGGFVAAGTKIQEAAGIKDSPQRDWEDAVMRGEKLNQFLKTDTAVARMIFEEQGKAVEWLQKLGVKFEGPGYGYGNEKRLHYFSPTGTKGNSAAIKVLEETAKKMGVQIKLNSRLVELVSVDNSLGSPIIGAVVENKDGKKQYIRALCGVIIASGGFGRNPEMVKRYHPYLEGIPSFSSPLATGDGIKAALAHGAAINVTHSDLGGTFACTVVKDPTVRINGFAPGNMPMVIVNKDGNRIIDESMGGRYISAAMVTTHNPKTYWIFDAKDEAQAQDKWFKPLFAKGFVHKYDSLEMLAKAEGIDWKNLQKTVSEYNEDVKAGKDRVFGKTKLFTALDKAPFFVIEAQPTILYTYTGLWINTKTQVLDTEDKPIPGLYAVGDISGRWDAIVGLGQGGMSGLSLATVTGRVAGKQTALACAKK